MGRHSEGMQQERVALPPNLEVMVGVNLVKTNFFEQLAGGDTSPQVDLIEQGVHYPLPAGMLLLDELPQPKDEHTGDGSNLPSRAMPEAPVQALGYIDRTGHATLFGKRDLGRDGKIVMPRIVRSRLAEMRDDMSLGPDEEAHQWGAMFNGQDPDHVMLDEERRTYLYDQNLRTAEERAAYAEESIRARAEEIRRSRVADERARDAEHGIMQRAGLIALQRLATQQAAATVRENAQQTWPDGWARAASSQAPPQPSSGRHARAGLPDMRYAGPEELAEQQDTYTHSRMRMTTSQEQERVLSGDDELANREAALAQRMRRQTIQAPSEVRRPFAEGRMAGHVQDHAAKTAASRARVASDRIVAAQNRLDIL